VISQIWETITAKRIKIDPAAIVSNKNDSPLNVLFSDVYNYVDVAGRSSARGL